MEPGFDPISTRATSRCTLRSIGRLPSCSSIRWFLRLHRNDAHAAQHGVTSYSARARSLARSCWVQSGVSKGRETLMGRHEGPSLDEDSEPNSKSPSTSENGKARRWPKVLAWTGGLLTPVIVAALTPAGPWLVDQTKFALGIPPFTVTVNFDTGLTCPAWVVPKTIEAVPVPSSPIAFDEGWAAAASGADADTTAVRITLQGSSDNAVDVQDVKVRTLNRAKPSGVVVGGGPNCGAGLTPRHYHLDLDATHVTAVAQAGTTVAVDPNDASIQSRVPMPAVPFPYVISTKDLEEIDMTADTHTCWCEWVLELSWSASGHAGTTEITADGVTPHGRPFRTSASTGLPQYQYTGATGHWTPGPAH